MIVEAMEAIWLFMNVHETFIECISVWGGHYHLGIWGYHQGTVFASQGAPGLVKWLHVLGRYMQSNHPNNDSQEAAAHTITDSVCLTAGNWHLKASFGFLQT